VKSFLNLLPNRNKNAAGSQHVYEVQQYRFNQSRKPLVAQFR
jgi:hypothetical protein